MGQWNQVASMFCYYDELIFLSMIFCIGATFMVFVILGHSYISAESTSAICVI